MHDVEDKDWELTLNDRRRLGRGTVCDRSSFASGVFGSVKGGCCAKRDVPDDPCSVGATMGEREVMISEELLLVL
jgi:hypothetical protein